VVTIGFVKVDRVMVYGETKSVFENKRVIVGKVNLCIFDVGV
jgi:hypothetical protein